MFQKVINEPPTSESSRGLLKLPVPTPSPWIRVSGGKAEIDILNKLHSYPHWNKRTITYWVNLTRSGVGVGVGVGGVTVWLRWIQTGKQMRRRMTSEAQGMTSFVP